ncbi:hypothetical protein X740_07725 [Mesorhizobium sp. LNHC221B00]|nr:hypothetical protein X740_07725 [Mesorhizobium sp. LNHC221B00]
MLDFKRAVRLNVPASVQTTWKAARAHPIWQDALRQNSAALPGGERPQRLATAVSPDDQLAIHQLKSAHSGLAFRPLLERPPGGRQDLKRFDGIEVPTSGGMSLLDERRHVFFK